MKRKIFIILIGIIFLAGLTSCGAIRKDLINLSESDIKNAETTRIVAQNMLKTWQINSGFILGVLGDRINELPASVFNAFKDLNDLSLRYQNGTLSDFELGYSVGIRIRILSAIVQQAIKQYAPEILQYLPSLLAF